MALKLTCRHVGKRLLRNGGKRLSTAAATAEKPLLCHFRTPESDPAKHTKLHDGLFYTVPPEVITSVFQVNPFPKKFGEMNDMFAECSIMVRPPFLEIKSLLESYDYSLPALRVMIYGKYGCGKTMTLAHLLHYAHTQKDWLIISKMWAPHWVKRPKEAAPQGPDEVCWDSPVDAAVWLQHFRFLNAPVLNQLELTTSKKYQWSEREETAAGEPLVNVIQHGVERIKHACDCVGALLQELKQYSNAGRVKTLVAVDGVNCFWQDTYLKRTDRSYVAAKDLSLVRHFLEVLKGDWCNAAVVVVVDELALSLRHHNLKWSNVPSYYPHHLLGKHGLEFFEPFVPVHVPKYNEKEIESCLDFYIDRGFIQNRKGWTTEGRAELKFLSGYNPMVLGDLCRTR
ncbi:small ribosomal subunit protein mS29-like [Ornithodoros turicata]|uniref:small ribosomal subunit protein mS29-like n=1 Tax=Ornithodoros turicata TaxID=34597 RepID=UPI00313A0A83